MKTLKIIKTFATIEEFRNSEYPMKNASNFGYEHCVKSELARWEKYSPTIYICEADPINEYGLDFTIQLCYMADGIQFLMKWDITSSSMSNGGLRRVIIDGKTIEFGDIYYDKGAANRNALREHSQMGWIFG
jgi:hypothetical protein